MCLMSEIGARLKDFLLHLVSFGSEISWLSGAENQRILCIHILSYSPCVKRRNKETDESLPEGFSLGLPKNTARHFRKFPSDEQLSFKDIGKICTMNVRECSVLFIFTLIECKKRWFHFTSIIKSPQKNESKTDIFVFDSFFQINYCKILPKIGHSVFYFSPLPHLINYIAQLSQLT